ncbi:6936_t:CDS:2 [Paraglomus occultum]|uniref:6936_t:CDS:1 n=1 Tax=Paraglomus occultum TaxID=144539 RepID=A0A9N9BNZ7_9GLOM|nr:6936_t:CDS:2 [Paraglomus occultum]
MTSFDAGHEDLIHDVAYDFYGKRLVTCSSDQRLKVREFVEETGVWEDVATWKAHDGSILRVAWAHPEYGQVIASCSFDRTVRIWEEQEYEPKNSDNRFGMRARLPESKSAVQDIEFAPNALGLKLAAVAADGSIRIYEAMEVTNLKKWTLLEEFNVSGSIHMKEAEGNYCISWCPSRFHASMIAVGCGKEARIYKQNAINNWAAIITLYGHKDTIHDISWAPAMGRSYQLIATASKDHFVRIYKLTPAESGYFNVSNVAEFSDHGAEVWRVEWNITGTILASSGDDGKVRLWKANHKGEWKWLSTIDYDKPRDFMEQ